MHWDRGELAKTIYANKESGRDLLAGDYEKFQAFTDMEYMEEQKYVAIDFFKDLYFSYPGSLFIFNDRDVDAWIKSRIKHAGYVKRTKEYLGINEMHLVKQYWKEQYRNHKKSVFDFFEDKEGLIYLNIDQQGWEEKFCVDMTNAGIPISPKSQHVGKTK